MNKSRRNKWQTKKGNTHVPIGMGLFPLAIYQSERYNHDKVTAPASDANHDELCNKRTN